MLVSTLTHAPGALLHMQVRSLGGGCCHHISSILASEVTGTATGHWTSSVPDTWSTLVASQQVRPCTSDPGPQIPS